MLLRRLHNETVGKSPNDSVYLLIKASYTRHFEVSAALCCLPLFEDLQHMMRDAELV